MGLIDGLLEPVYGGFPGILLPPTTFLQQPIRWLQAISRYRGTHSGGPNFAFALCAGKITPAQHATLDLSCWETAYNGAEPVRHDTLTQFATTFRDAGFQSRFAYPCYGLAEATLMVSGGHVAVEPIIRHISGPALEQHKVTSTPADDPAARTLVSSGRVFLDTTVRIVHPDTRTPCAPDEIGEIWIAGPTVARGYWQRPQETEEVFHARLANDDDGPFLRSGDLGFLHDGELFVTGRIKDLIIVRGRNHYPQDIEFTVERSHPAVRAGCVAAFGLENAGTEQLGIVAELRRNTAQPDHAPIIDAIRAAIAATHDITPQAITLLPPSTIPKTSSGKIQRHASRAAFLNNTLPALATWQEETTPAPSPAPRPTPLVSWLVQRLARQFGIDPQHMRVDTPLADYGLDSVTAVGLSGELETWLGRKLPPTLLYEHPTIAALARALAGDAPEPPPTPVTESSDAVAIVGLGCRFPGADGPQAFWDLLANGRDAITEVPATRWDAATFYAAETQPGKMTTRWGGFLPAIDQFDASFFGISPREAERMDPQQRLLLEVAWEALEDAGIPPHQLSGTSTGVFVGISGMEYGQMQLNDSQISDAYIGTGSALSIAANRLSYFLNLHGPSLAIDTACSASLVALHYARHSLQQGECRLALVGGVNLILSPTVTVNFSQAGFMAPDGRCKPFDARANGYVRSEGAGVVVLKPLAQAQADGDTIYAVIAGSAVNQDGRSNGLTAPNRAAQEAVLRAAYDNAGIPPQRVQYVEAHGTGTALGDPIEAAALGQVLGRDRTADKPCHIGSVKSNLGHLEAAAGIAGIIKVALALQNGQIPPSLHYREPNPAIPFTNLRLRVQDTLTPWQPDENGKRIAGISAFGFGGTNAHVVLHAPIPQDAPRPTPHTPHPTLLPLSARDPQALADLAQRYAHLLQTEPDLTTVAAAASRRRDHHDHRLALVATDAAAAITHLRAFAAAPDTPAAPPLFRDEKHPNRQARLVFVCGGQGPQWWGMGRQLLAAEPVFRAVMEQCDRLLRPYTGWSLLQELTRPQAESRLDQTDITQPALFALQLSLAALWRSWGVQPHAVVGHSMGEVAAACISGALSLEDGARVIYHRGRLMQTTAGQGKMLIVELTEAEARAALRGYEAHVDIAAINPTSVVLSGSPDGVTQLRAALDDQGIHSEFLRVDYASHSPQMTPLQPEMVAALEGIQPRRPALSLYSTVTGARVADATPGPDYWSANMRQPVQFAAAMRQMLADDCTTFLELNPHPVLAPSISQSLRQHGQAGVVLTSMKRDQDELAQMRQALAALYVQGWEVDWAAVQPQDRRIPLPRYPWQRRRYWLPTPPPWRDPAALPATSSPLSFSPDWLYEMRWEPLIAPAGRNGSGLAHRHCLILGPANGLSQELTDRLRQTGSFPQLVSNCPADWSDVLDAQPTTHIVYLWSIDGDPEYSPDLVPVLQLAQALARRHQPPRLWLVTRGAQPATAAPLRPAQALLWGFGRALALEHPDLWGGLVDLDPAQPEGEVDALLAYLQHPGLERQIAFRDGQALAPRAHPAPLEPLPPPHFPADATYLITGGLGDLGLALARWLARHGARRLALLGRTPLPPRVEWNAAAGNGHFSQPIATIRDLEAAGVTVLLLTADVGDRASLEAAFARLAALQGEGLMPPPRGVFHLAGVAAPQPLTALTPAALQAALHAKVAGTLHLHALTTEMDLTHFVMFSSLAGALGSKDLAHYGAANAFMDSFAHYRRQREMPALSVNWGAWADGGMSVKTGQEAYLRRLGMRPMPPAAALDTLGQILRGGMTQRLVVDMDWRTFRGVYEMGAPQPILSHLGAQPPSPPMLPANTPIRRQLESAAPAGWPTLLTDYLRQRVGHVLRMPASDINTTRGIVELGLDSIMVMELIRQFQTDLGLSLFMREIFDRPSLTDLAAYLAAQLHDKAPTPVPIAAARILAPSHPAPRLNGKTNHADHPPTVKNPPAVFLLSGPRSGSTLLRVMLAGHPDLFSPPELHLLPYATMQDRQTSLAQTYLDQGLQRAVMSLFDLDAAGSKAKLAAWLQANRPIQEVYAELQQAAHPRLLLDKTPSYAFQRATLDRAETLFDAPRYIHLVRHPYAAIDSSIRTRLDRLLGDNMGDPLHLAEEIWVASNQNTREFLHNIPPERKLLVHYEELVRQPEATMRRVCAFLGLPFHPAMLRPYEGDRMTDGIYAQSLQIGDPRFLEHRGIDASLADAWKNVRLPRPLGPRARQLAAHFQYELPREIELTSLVPLHPQGSKPPLFLVPPNGSTVLTFTELARHLGPDQPVYGLEPLGLDGRHAPHNRVEEMAAHYLRELRTVQPRGPYLLGGRCFGGIVAFEMAQQLQRQGEKVAMLAVLDVLVPPHTTLQVWRSADTDGDGVSAVRHYLYRGMYLLRRGPLKQLMWVRRLRQIRQEEGILPNVFGPQARYIKETSDAHFQARLNYEPRVYAGRITLFSNSEVTGGRLLNWAELTTAGVDIHIIPGNHLTMLQQPHLQELVNKLRHTRDKALADSTQAEARGGQPRVAARPAPSLPPTSAPAAQQTGQPSPPHSALERQLASIWRNILGREVGMTERLEETAGNPLHAAYLCATIQEQLGVYVPLTALAQAGTLAGLAAWLERGEAMTWHVLTRLSGGDEVATARPPFFCVPDDGGTVLSLLPLARHLGPEWPVYGVQPLGLEPGQLPHETIEDMAAYYLQAVRTVQPHGPYRIGGHALGGIVAFEMAQQLWAQGEQVAHLAVIDTLIPPNATHHVWDPPRSLENKGAETGNRLDRVIARIAYLVQRRRLLRAVPPPPEGTAGEGAARRMRHLRDVAFAARFRYQPRAYGGKITLYANAMHTGRHQVKWAALTDAGIEIEIIPGNHETLFLPEHMGALAEPLCRHLRDSIQ